MVEILLNSCSPREKPRRAKGALSYKFRTSWISKEAKAKFVGVKSWLRTRNHEARRIFGAVFRRASRLVAHQILAIPCRANSTEITKDLRKVLLGLEATGHGHVQYSRIGSAQHRFSTLNPLAQNKLMRGLAR